MRITAADPRPTWWRLSSQPALDEEDRALVRTLPAGAREAPLAWVCTTGVERRWSYDRDSQEEVSHDQTIVTGWRDEPDPRIRNAGLLSFRTVELAEGVLPAFPQGEWLGDSISALTLAAEQLAPGVLERIGGARPWADLSIFEEWRRATRPSCVRELAAAFPHLLGLELHSAALDGDELAVLAAAPFVPRLEDLTLSGRQLDEHGACALFERLGSLVHLDLRDARLTSRALGLLPAKLGCVRLLVLSHNALGDEGVLQLLDAGGLDRVEHLSLASCDLTNVSARALADASPPALRGLSIDGNRITDDGLEALVRAPLFARLESASLHQRGLTDRSGALLAGHPLEGALRGSASLPGIRAHRFLGR